MPIDVRCECGKEFKVDESRVGQRGKCKCGRVILVELPGGLRRVIIGTKVVDGRTVELYQTKYINGPGDYPDGQSSRDLVARTKAARADKQRMAELQAECDRLNAENTVPGRIYRVAMNTVSMSGGVGGPEIYYQDVGPRPPGSRIPGTYGKSKKRLPEDGDV